MTDTVIFTATKGICTRPELGEIKTDSRRRRRHLILAIQNTSRSGNGLWCFAVLKDIASPERQTLESQN